MRDFLPFVILIIGLGGMGYFGYRAISKSVDEQEVKKAAAVHACDPFIDLAQKDHGDGIMVFCSTAQPNFAEIMFVQIPVK
jgi:hypothetical protein